METLSKCTKIKCPFQYDKISSDCNIPECPYRTEISNELINLVIMSYLTDKTIYAYILHKETGCSIKECVNVHTKAIEYLRSLNH